MVYVYKRGSQKRWIVVLAAYPGRDSVKSGASVIGTILANGELE